jgi:hypothetical protein
VNLAMLRVEGLADSLGKISRTLEIQPDGCWSAGEQSARGVTYASSGFSFTIVDALNPVEMVSAIQHFIELCRERAVTFAHPELVAELSVGITVGEAEQFVASVDLPATTVGLLAGLGLAPSVTAYPSAGA